MPKSYGNERKSGNEQDTDYMQMFLRGEEAAEAAPAARPVSRRAKRRDVENETAIPNDALVRKEDGTLEYGGVKFTKLGLDLPDSITHEQLENVWQVIVMFDDSLQWMIGDAILYGRKFKGEDETYADVEAKLGGRYSAKTLRSIVSVAGKIEMSLRRDNLSFSHHKAIAESCSTRQEIIQWLEVASNEDMSVAKLNAAMNPARKRAGKGERWRDVISDTESYFTATRLKQLTSERREEVYNRLLNVVELIERIERDGDVPS